MISQATNKSSDLFQQAMGSFQTALQAGAKLHEDSVAQCVEILRDVGSPMEWERTVPTKVTKAIAAMQQNVDQSIRFVNDNAQQTVNLMEKALETHQTDSDVNGEDGHVWACTLEAMHTNADVLHQANARVLQSWGDLAKEVLQRVEIMREEVNRMTEVGMRQA